MVHNMTADGRRNSTEATEALLTPNVTNMTETEKKIEQEEKPGDQISPLKRIPFPNAAICILSTKLFERFAFHGIRTVLVLYLTTELAFSSQNSTVIFHSFNAFTFVMCVFGAIVSDCWLGKYRTILLFSIAYAIGVLLMTLGSIPPFGLPARELSIIALLLIAGGSGCLKPCLLALGGDQFKRPEQDRQLDIYYSLMYMMLKVSYLFGTAVTPILRNDVKCFGDDYCFPMAFGVPGSFVILSLASYVLGSRWYVKNKPAGNILFQVAKCIWNAGILRWRNRKTDPKPHWLDHAEPKYGIPLVNDVKVLLNVIVLFIPLPMFYALNEQVGSRWTFQAASMDGDLGFYTIKPDQMQIFMPFMVMVFIILLDSCLYKQLERIGIKESLHKMLLGTCMAMIAFVIAGGLILHTEPTMAVQPLPNHAQVRMFNSIPCGFRISSKLPELNGILLPSMDMYSVDVPVPKLPNPFLVTLDSDSPNCQVHPITMNLTAKTAMSYLIRDNQNVAFMDSPRKDINGLATLRILVNNPTGQSLSVTDLNRKNYTVTSDSNSTLPLRLRPSSYAIIRNQKIVSQLELGPGSVTTILLGGANGAPVTKTFEITPPNTVHILYMIPQYVFLALGEAMLAVTGLKFAYNEAPNSMKAVVQAIYLFTISGGNLIDLVVVGANIFQSEAYLTFLFAGLMFIDVLFFLWLVKRYKPIKCEQPHDN